MRTLFVIGALALFFSSCSDVERFRAPIESLSTEWENTTAMATEFVNTLQTTQRDLQDKFAQLSVPEELTLSEASADQVAELKDDYQEELSSLTDLSQEVSTFISDWQGKEEMLNELKEGLAAGNLGGSTMGTIEAVQTNIEEAKSTIEDWQGELEDIRANNSEILESFSELIADLQGN